MESGSNFVRRDGRIPTQHWLALPESGAIVEHHSSECSDRACDKTSFQVEDSLPRPAKKNDGGPELAERFNLKLLTVHSEYRLSAAGQPWKHKNESRQRGGRNSSPFHRHIQY